MRLKELNQISRSLRDFENKKHVQCVNMKIEKPRDFIYDSWSGFPTFMPSNEMKLEINADILLKKGRAESFRMNIDYSNEIPFHGVVAKTVRHGLVDPFVHNQTFSIVRIAIRKAE